MFMDNLHQGGSVTTHKINNSLQRYPLYHFWITKPDSRLNVYVNDVEIKEGDIILHGSKEFTIIEVLSTQPATEEVYKAVKGISKNTKFYTLKIK